MRIEPICDFGIKPWVANVSAGERVADEGCGCRMAANDDVQPATFARLRRFAAGKDDELDSSSEPFRAFPTGQRVPLVRAHDPEEAGFREDFSHSLGGLIGIGWTVLAEFKIIDNCPR